MAKSDNVRDEVNKKINNQRDQRLASLKKKSGKKNRHNRKPKYSSQSNKFQQELESTKQKLGVYENIIEELRTKNKEQLGEIVDLKSQVLELTTQATQQETESIEQPEQAETNDDQITISVLEQEKDDWKNKALRMSADLQNLQKQSELDIQQAKKSAKKSTIYSILEFLNTLNISFNYTPDTEDQKVINFVTTLKGSFDKVINDLSNQGIEIIPVKPGDKFDAEYMNILNTQVGDGGEIENIVVQVVGLGLKVDGQLIQPSSVIIK